MSNKNYRTTLHVNKPRAAVFRDINNVAAWWNEGVTGSSVKLNDEFTVRFGDVHLSTQRLVEVIPDQRVAWLVTKGDLNFVNHRSEWEGTTIVFDLSEKDGGTQVEFTHVGLVPKVECYDACSKGWDYYIKGSLLQLLSTGKGTPELR